MHQAIRQHLIITYAISLGLMTVYMSLLQPIPSASAQQLTGTVSQGASGTATQERRIDNIAPIPLYPKKSLEKMDAQTLTNKPHRLIRKPQNAPVASVEPSPSSTSPVSSVPTDNTTSQSKEPSSVNRNVGATLPLATISVAPSSATTSGSVAVGTASTGTIPQAASGTGNSSTSGSGSVGGRSMSRLASEMPGLTQLLSPPLLSVTPPPPSTPTPTIGLTPSALSFSAVQNGAAPASQPVTITNAGTGTLTWTAVSTMPWLKVNGAASASGTNTGTFAITVSPTGLSPGAQAGGLVTVTASGATNTPQSIPVTFTITAAPTPTIGLTPSALSFSAVQNGAAPASQPVTITNAGTGTLTWTAASTVPWLKVNGAASASGTNTGTFAITVSPTGLSPGAQAGGLVTVTASGATNTPQNIPVTFTITAAPTPTIGLSSTNLSFTGVQGGTSPAAQTVTINNSGSGTLTWTASGSASWLSISPTSGSVLAGSSNTLSVSVSTTGLAAGTISTPIMISGAGATNTPQTITASLTVTAQPSLGLSPMTFSFTATQGAANPAPKTLNVSNPGSGTLTWSIIDNASWLTLTPASGTTTTGTSPVTLSVNTAGLLAGPSPLTATITVTGTTATNSPQMIPVTLTVSAPTTSSATLTWAPNTDSDLAGYRIYRATVSGVYGAALATVPAGTVTYVATGLSANTTYFFVITAYDSVGNESPFSNEVSKSIF